MSVKEDPWAPTRAFFEGLEELRAEEAKNGPVKLYRFKEVKEKRRGIDWFVVLSWILLIAFCVAVYFGAFIGVKELVDLVG